MQHKNEPKTNKKEDKRNFNIGDKVLLQKEKNYHRPKGESQFYTDKYTIVEISQTNPPTYQLKNKNDEILPSNYYKQQLLKVPENIKNTDSKPDVIMAEKIRIDKHIPEKRVTRSDTRNLRSLFKR